jgi:hypothetical protein
VHVAENGFPEPSTYASEEQVSSYWICPKCGNEFETSMYLTRDVPLTPEVVDAFFSDFVGCLKTRASASVAARSLFFIRGRLKSP